LFRSGISIATAEPRQWTTTTTHAADLHEFQNFKNRKKTEKRKKEEEEQVY
jgi:hypothetical protein